MTHCGALQPDLFCNSVILSNTLCYTFILAIMTSCSYERFSLKGSYPRAIFLGSSSLESYPRATLLGSSSKEMVLITPPPGLPSQGRMQAASWAERLGKVQPCCFMSTFLPLCLSQGLGRKSFFVLISSNKNNEFLKPARM